MTPKKVKGVKVATPRKTTPRKTPTKKVTKATTKTIVTLPAMTTAALVTSTAVGTATTTAGTVAATTPTTVDATMTTTTISVPAVATMPSTTTTTTTTTPGPTTTPVIAVLFDHKVSEDIRVRLVSTRGALGARALSPGARVVADTPTDGAVLWLDAVHSLLVSAQASRLAALWLPAVAPGFGIDIDVAVSLTFKEVATFARAGPTWLNDVSIVVDADVGDPRALVTLLCARRLGIALNDAVDSDACMVRAVNAFALLPPQAVPAHSNYVPALTVHAQAAFTHALEACTTAQGEQWVEARCVSTRHRHRWVRDGMLSLEAAAGIVVVAAPSRPADDPVVTVEFLKNHTVQLGVAFGEDVARRYVLVDRTFTHSTCSAQTGSS